MAADPRRARRKRILLGLGLASAGALGGYAGWKATEINQRVGAFGRAADRMLSETGKEPYPFQMAHEAPLSFMRKFHEQRGEKFGEVDLSKKSLRYYNSNRQKWETVELPAYVESLDSVIRLLPADFRNALEGSLKFQAYDHVETYARGSRLDVGLFIEQQYRKYVKKTSNDAIRPSLEKSVYDSFLADAIHNPQRFYRQLDGYQKEFVNEMLNWLPSSRVTKLFNFYVSEMSTGRRARMKTALITGASTALLAVIIWYVIRRRTHRRQNLH
jgi:hypothetical protein